MIFRGLYTWSSSNFHFYGFSRFSDFCIPLIGLGNSYLTFGPISRWYRDAIPTKIGRSISKTLYLTFLMRNEKTFWVILKAELSQLKPGKTLKKSKIWRQQSFCIFYYFFTVDRNSNFLVTFLIIWAFSFLFLKFYQEHPLHRDSGLWNTP